MKKAKQKIRDPSPLDDPTSGEPQGPGVDAAGPDNTDADQFAQGDGTLGDALGAGFGVVDDSPSLSTGTVNTGDNTPVTSGDDTTDTETTNADPTETNNTTVATTEDDDNDLMVPDWSSEPLVDPDVPDPWPQGLPDDPGNEMMPWGSAEWSDNLLPVESLGGRHHRAEVGRRFVQAATAAGSGEGDDVHGLHDGHSFGEVAGSFCGETRPAVPRQCEVCSAVVRGRHQ